MKLFILPKVTYRFNTFSIKIITAFFFFLRNVKADPQTHMEFQAARIAKTISKKKTTGILILQDLLQSYSN